MQDEEAQARRLEREIAIFEGHEALHEHGAAFHFYNAIGAWPAVGGAFGRRDLHEIVAEILAAGVARSGLQTIYSLGCGDGLQEQAILRAADRMGLPAFRIQGLELAPAVAERANALAADSGLADRLHVMVHDLNTGFPGTEPAAGVLAFQMLHHIVELEGLFGRVAERLHPEGAFAVCDMIGRNGHMRWPEVRPLMRRLWAMLPPEKRFDHSFRRPAPWFQDWDCAIEGFEGVRAQDILLLLAQHFEVSRFAAWGGVADSFINDRMAPNFDPAAPLDRAFLERLAALEIRLLAERRTTPSVLIAEYRSRRSGFRAPPEAAAAQARALRQPGEIFPSLESEAFASPYPPNPPAPLPVLAAGQRHAVAPATPVAAALHEGWEPPEEGMAWAILDEQFLRFRTEPPARRVAVEIWVSQPAARKPTIRAEAEGCAPATTGLLAEPAVRTLALEAPAPRAEWEVRLTASTYRLPDADGGVDRRPLAYVLRAVEVGDEPPRTGARHWLRRWLGRS
jgi:hypothetical protein